MVHPYYGILFRSKKEWNTDTCSDLDGSQEHYDELGKKANFKRLLLYDSIYITF